MKKPADKKDAPNKQETQEEHPSVKQGKAAIEAARLANPEPVDVTEKKEREDAEKWRNEG
jgi:hypothetical protein